MVQRYTFLGFPLTVDSPSPPAIPTIELSPFMQMPKDEANVTLMKLTSHTGTHLDTPGHVVPDGLRLTAFNADEFVFHRPVVLDLPMEDAAIVQPEHLQPFVDQAREADLLLFRFGYGPIRRSDPQRYSASSPGFGVESAAFLREKFPKMRALGMDVPSLSTIAYLDRTFLAHHALLGGAGRRFIVIEDMNLDQDLSALATVFVAPLLVKDIDGCPCTVIGALNHD